MPLVLEPIKQSQGGRLVLEPVSAPPLVNQSVAAKSGPDTQAQQIDLPTAQLFAEWDRSLREPAKVSNIRKNLKAPGAALMGAVESYVDGTLALPSIAADVASYGPRAAFNAVTGGIEAGNKTPWFGVTPRLTTKTLTGLVGGEDALENRELIRDKIYPEATSLGEIGGDVALLTRLKAPLAKTLWKGERTAAQRVHKAEEGVAAANEAIDAGRITKAQANQLRLRNKPIAKKFQKWGVRGVEAGAEGALLAVIKDGDPVKTAGATAGMQVGNNLLQDVLLHPLIKKNRYLGAGARFAAQTAVMGYLIQTVSEALPGEDLKDYEAREKGIQKYLAAYGAGLAAAVLNGRGHTGGFARRKLQLSQAVTSIPRHTVTSLVSSWTRLSPEERLAAAPKVQEYMDGSKLEQMSPGMIKRWDAAVRQGGDAVLKFIMEN